MRADTHALEALLERIRQAEGPDRELDAAIWCAISQPKRTDQPCHFRLPDVPEHWAPGSVLIISGTSRAVLGYEISPPLTSSLDACADLQAEALPGWVRLTVSNDSTGLVEVTLFQTDDPRAHVGDTNERECLAWLAAILSAVLAKANAEVADV